MYVLGFDIGGTKSAVILAEIVKDQIEFIERNEVKTKGSWKEVLDTLLKHSINMLNYNNINKKDIKIGISSGGPLDSKKGIILSPPNLPGWKNVPIVEYIYEKIGIKAKLKNDADASALAEWRYGAGKNYKNLIFLTFGTGLGAGLILNGKLYKGANDMAGEVGHIRLSDKGPIGYNKSGSFEGYCSGGGISNLAKEKAYEMKSHDKKASFVKKDIESISAKDVSDSAKLGNKDAIDIFNISAKYFGKGISILIDILNPELIIVGSIFTRSKELFESEMYKQIEKEALYLSRKDLKIVPAKLDERIGDYAAIVTAIS